MDKTSYSMTVTFNTYINKDHKEIEATASFSGNFIQMGNDFVDIDNQNIPVTVAIVETHGSIMHAVPKSMKVTSGSFEKHKMGSTSA